MKATVFNAGTGKIERIVSAPAGSIGVQLQPGEDWIEGEYQDDQFYVERFVAVKMPPRPANHHRFNYTTRQWEDPRTLADLWAQVRAQRDRLLAACDWTQLPDAPTAQKQAWSEYRQALRDITQQADPESVVWPVPPA